MGNVLWFRQLRSSSTNAHVILSAAKNLRSVLLSSFGVGEGFEAYWSTLHLIETFPEKQLLHSLIQNACKDPNAGTRMWSCRILGRWRSSEDLPFLLDRLKDDVPEVRLEALSCVERLEKQNEHDH